MVRPGRQGRGPAAARACPRAGRAYKPGPGGGGNPCLAAARPVLWPLAEGRRRGPRGPRAGAGARGKAPERGARPPPAALGRTALEARPLLPRPADRTPQRGSPPRRCPEAVPRLRRDPRGPGRGPLPPGPRGAGRPARLQGSPGTAGHDPRERRRAPRRAGRLPALDAPAPARNTAALERLQAPVADRPRHADHPEWGGEPIGRRSRHRLKRLD